MLKSHSIGRKISNLRRSIRELIKDKIKTDDTVIKKYIENSRITLDFLHDSLLCGKNENHG